MISKRMIKGLQGFADKKLLDDLKAVLESIHAQLEMQTYLMIMDSFNLSNIQDAMIQSDTLFKKLEEYDANRELSEEED